MNKKYIIIGASAAAIGAINGIRRIDQDTEIICISAEAEMPYNKCFLADYLAGKKELAHLAILDEAQQAAKRVELILGTRIVKIDRENKAIYAADGRSWQYDTLLIATGSTPVSADPGLPARQATPGRPQVPDILRTTSAQGIFTFQTAADAQAIIAYAAQHAVTTAIVVGTGLTGLECADALLQRGITVHIIQRGTQVMSNQLDAESAELLATRGAQAGVQFHTQDQVIDIIQSDGGVTGVQLASGKELPANLVVFATGFKPASGLAQDAGLVLDQSAIVTNDYMQTSDPHIYAAGDVALVKDQITGQKMISCLWPDAMLQGMIAGHNISLRKAMAGQHKSYPGMVPIMSSAFFGIKVACYQSPMDDEQHNLITHTSDADFYKIYTQDQRVRSFSLLGSLSLLPSLKRALLTKSPFIIE